jgi:hypothetical protein
MFAAAEAEARNFSELRMVETVDQGELGPDRSALARWDAVLTSAQRAAGPLLLLASACGPQYVSLSTSRSGLSSTTLIGPAPRGANVPAILAPCSATSLS